MRTSATIALLLFAFFASGADAPSEPRIAPTNDLRSFAPPKEKGKAELIEGRNGGKAIRFAFEKDARSTFFSARLRGGPEWDKAAGFSFMVKDDGTDAFGGLQFIFDNDYAVRYDFCFPVKGKEWTKVTVAWADLIPVLPGPKAKPLGGAGGNAPSKLTGLSFGKWWYWGDYPAHAFAVDDIRLEAIIKRDTADHKPVGGPLDRVRGKLLAGKPINVVTMGDSLTDPRHHANRKVVWPDLLRDSMKTKHGSVVTVVNPAIGGTQLMQNLVLMPRWLETTPEPDLVTVFFGGNDWDAGVRGDEFTKSCAEAVDRIRRATKGKADVLILTTAPSVKRWDALAELGKACRTAAADRRAGLADVDAAFHAAAKDDPDRLFIFDKVHLSPAGHALVAEEVLKAIEAKAAR